MKVSKRIITFFLAIAMLGSLLSVATASSSSGLLVDSATVSAWDSLIRSSGGTTSEYWSKANDLMSRAFIGECESYGELNFIVDKYDSFGSGLLHLFQEIFVDLFKYSDYIVMFDESLGVYRPYDNNFHLWFVNSRGHFPYYRPDSSSGDGSGDAPDPEEPYRPGQWLQVENVDMASSYWHAVSTYTLNDYRKQWLDAFPNAQIVKADGCKWLVASVYGKTFILCDDEGFPYFIPVEGESAVSTPNEYFTNITNNYIDDKDTTVNVVMDGNTLVGQVIDNENGIISVGGEIYYIDELLYNPETNTYYVDAHTEYTYNSTTNNYNTEWNVTMVEYHIYYTSVTYIGQTEEYQERYEYYYQLPDGRSSADLTAEDLEQLSIVFADLVPYTRTADDTDLRALYHFDGTTEDSSYWSYITEFTWNTGASLTYLDEGTFNGSLYLDELEHDFTIKLPNLSDCAGDFTLQFRYYQSHTESPVMDSYIMLGSSVVWQSDGAQMYDSAGNALWGIPVGSWNEICFVRSGGTVYYYLNGVCVGSAANSPNFDGTITFHFGNEQQTYKKLDELRFTKRALYTAGAAYAPTSVPHDTNLALILPDGEYAIADEIMDLTPSTGNLFNASGLNDWTQGAPDGLTVFNHEAFQYGVIDQNFRNGPMIVYNSNLTFLRPGENSTKLTTSFQYVAGDNKIDDYNYYYGNRAGLFVPLVGCTRAGPSQSQLGTPSNVWYSCSGGAGTYTLTVVLSDGRYSTITAAVGEDGSLTVLSNSDCSAVYIDPIEFSATRDLTSAGASSIAFTRKYARGFVIMPTVYNQAAEIIHIELAASSKPLLSITWDNAVFTSSQLENSPVLAVRTNREITGYQIGGVRPSYPTKGLVYAMVENGRIASLQQYTGTAWEAVDGRIWTGERWIPYSSFDVFTLQDFYDVSGTTDDYEYIYSEAGFWSWLQRAWSKMLQKLDAIIIALGGDPDKLPGDGFGSEEDLPFWQRVKRIFENSLANILESLLDLISGILDLVLGVIYDLLEFFFGLLSDAVINGIGGFFDALMDETLLLFFQSEEPVLDENGEPVLDENGDPVTVAVVALPSGVAAVFAFISGTIMVLPDEVRYILLFGISSLFLFAVLKLMKL